MTDNREPRRQTPQSAALGELTAFVAEAQGRRTRLRQLVVAMQRARDDQPIEAMEDLTRYIHLADSGIAACTRTIQACGAAFLAIGTLDDEGLGCAPCSPESESESEETQTRER